MHSAPVRQTDVGRKGRPFGGCAVLWHKNLSLAATPITTTSTRICAVDIKSDNTNFLLITVYMPNDDNSDNSYDIFGDVLSQVSSIRSTYDQDIIIGGDFNVDFHRNNSKNLNLLKQFLQVEDLKCATLDIVNNNFTREDRFSSRSFIDHFIVNNNILYSNIDVMYNGNNLSDHNPVVIKTAHNILYAESNFYKYKILLKDCFQVQNSMELFTKTKTLLHYNTTSCCKSF